MPVLEKNGTDFGDAHTTHWHAATGDTCGPVWMSRVQEDKDDSTSDRREEREGALLILEGELVLSSELKWVMERSKGDSEY